MTAGPATAAVSTLNPQPLLWGFAGVLLYLSFGYTEMMGSDLWWHIAAGREIVQTETLHLVDDWSYTELGSPWRNHEWMADLVFYGWVQLFGVASLVYWKWGLIVATFLLLQRLLQSMSASPAAALVASTAAVTLAAPFLDLRPQLYTLLGVAVLLNLCLGRTARLRELLPLFLLWANLHGGFIFGLMLLAILQTPWRSITESSLKSAAGTVLACTAVCLLNPDGLQLFWLPLVYAFDSSSPYRSLAEWRSPFSEGGIQSPAYIYSLVLAAGLLPALVLPRVRRAIPLWPETLMIVLLTGAMSATSRRFIILWAFAFALLLAPWLGMILRYHVIRPLMPVVLLAAFATGFYRLAAYPLRADIAFHYLAADYAYPHAVADFVQLNALEGKTFAYYNWGGYLHWRTDGALKVFIDGRANTLFDDRTYRAYVAVYRAQPGWLQRIENSGAEFFLWPRTRGGDRLIRGLIDTRRWRLLYQDVRGVLLARVDVSIPETLRVPRGTVAASLAQTYNAYRRSDYRQAAVLTAQAYADRPWDYEVCRWRRISLQAVDQNAEADAVMPQCRDWFPSKYLR